MSRKPKRKVSKGTGKRYTSDRPRPAVEASPRLRPPEPGYTEKSLRRRIQGFAYQGDRFREDFEKAIELYLEQKPGTGVPLYFDDGDMPGFQEWYFNDFITRTGSRIIDLFIEEIGPRLNDAQRAMLADWLIWNRPRLLEFQELKPGIGVVVQDLLSGETFEVNDISASYSVTRWTFGLFRSICTAGRVSFTGSALLLPPTEKMSVLKTAQALWAAYQVEHPGASLPDFYRDHSLTLHLTVKRAAEKASRPPIPLSAEGHALVISKARYAIHGDPRQVEAMLDASEEFIYTGPSEVQRGALHYNWLQRGRSFVPQSVHKPEERAVLMKTQWTEGPGKPSFLNLGDLSLAEKWIELECLSRERLATGKALIESILGKSIRHVGDRFEDWEMYDRKHPLELDRLHEEPSRELAEEERIVQEEFLQSMTRGWLDQPSVDGGELTPRQAARTPEGRKKVIEVLKQIEYFNDLRIRDGKQPTMDLEYIRKELGL